MKSDSSQNFYKDHKSRPLFVNTKGKILLETFTKNADIASDFLIAIAEPITRPRLIHEYQITPYSLYAAASVGLTTDEIIDSLEKFSKNFIEKKLKDFIRDCTISYGKVKIITYKGDYFIESMSENILNRMLKDEILSDKLILNKNVSIDKKDDDISSKHNNEDENVANSPNSLKIINTKDVPLIKQRCIKIDYPLLEEYDFRSDTTMPNLNIDLKPIISIRPYQEMSLNKMFGNSRSKSGVIVLPCGAGKTLVGITSICTIKKSAIILCTSAVSVEQWRQQILEFTNCDQSLVKRFTSERKEQIDGESLVLITTYSMLCFSGKRSLEALKVMEKINKLEWGILILDEVHVVPAQVFRRVLDVIKHKTKLGLTATLLREDDKIEDLNFLIGPKLFEADWQSLSEMGHIAKVKCAEVWCEMTKDFYNEYLNKQGRRKAILAIMNPSKFRACEYLIKFHEQRNDKIIVFSDSVCALKTYALKLGKPFIYGPTSQPERMRILSQFQNNPNINTIFLSKVGDTSIDLPEATVLIQISSHFGSRRQEAQRLGRILRARRRNDPGFRVYFYSLVSMDTEEMYYSEKRRQFLIDQGYVFNILRPKDLYSTDANISNINTNINNILDSNIINENKISFFDLSLNKKSETFKNFIKESKLATVSQEKELLASILLASDIELMSEDDEEDNEKFVRTSDITNVERMMYFEDSSKNFNKKRKY